MAEAIMLAGTRKGLFIGRSDESRQQWEWDKGRRDPLLRRHRNGARAHLAARAGPCPPTPTRSRSQCRPGVSIGPPTRGRAGIPSIVASAPNSSPARRPNAANPDRLFAQNRGGVFRSDDAGQSWQSIAEGLPGDFGFPIVVHPHKPDTIDVFRSSPTSSASHLAASRVSGVQTTRGRRGAIAVRDCRSRPIRLSFATRSARAGRNPAGLYVGTRHGAIWVSNNEGDTWAEVRNNLPDVLCIRAAVI